MITKCKVEGCEMPVLAKGQCNRHYKAEFRAKYRKLGFVANEKVKKPKPQMPVLDDCPAWLPKGNI